MTLGVSDGKTLYAVRYASDGRAPTLLHSRDVAEVLRILPDVKGVLSPDARFIASEPSGRTHDIWVEVPQGSFVRVEDGKVAISPFTPIPPGVAVSGAGGRAR
jgi:glutamine amidotransferase